MKAFRRIACLMLILLLCTSVLGCGPSLQRESFVPITKEAHTELPASSAAPEPAPTEGETAASAAEEQTRQTETEESAGTTIAPAETVANPVESTAKTAVTTEGDATASGNQSRSASDPKMTDPTEPKRESGTAVSYIANTNTKKFHLPGCASVSTMKEENKLYFTGSREELIEQGYEPCKRCNP